MKKYAILFSLAFAVLFSLKSQEMPLSLGEAIQKGLQNNYQVQISGKNLEIAKNNNAWGNAGLFPTLTAGISQNNYFSNMTDSTVKVNTISPYIRLNWVLFDGFSVKINKDKFAFLEDLSDGNSAIIVENTIQAIVLSYYHVLLQKKKLEVIEELTSLTRDRYRYQLTRKELGNAVTFDVLQAKNAYLSDSSNVLLQKLNYETAIRNLNLVLAEAPQTIWELTEEFVFMPQYYSIDTLIKKMQSNNKTLINQYINQEILKKDVSLQRSDLYPRLSLSSGLENEKVLNTNDNPTLDFFANFTIDIALSNGGRVRRAIQNAKINEQIGNLKIQELEQSLYNQLYSAWQLYNARLQLYQVAMENENAARLNLTIAEEKYNLGAINSFNYRDIQLVFLNTAIDKLQAVYNLFDSHTELLRLTGGIIGEY